MKAPKVKQQKQYWMKNMVLGKICEHTSTRHVTVCTIFATLYWLLVFRRYTLTYIFGAYTLSIQPAVAYEHCQYTSTPFTLSQTKRKK